MFPIAQRLAGQGLSIWTEFLTLAHDCKAVNLGQGFPDYPDAAPNHIRENLAQIALNEPQLCQYTRGFGHLTLVNALANLYSNLLQREIDPLKEILITVGASNALFYTANAYLGPGDKAIIIEPFFTSYELQTKIAGAKLIYLPLRCSTKESASSSAQFELDLREFESILSQGGVKMLFLNNPNNPLGKVYTENELLSIAELAEKYNLMVIADEVCEWIVFPPNKMIRFATLPGMHKRTITIGSAGKTFSVTGWKTGWAIGLPSLIYPLMLMHQSCIYTCPTTVQEAIARSFEVEMLKIGSADSYWTQLVDSMSSKRKRLAEILASVGIVPIIPDGGYFMMADYQKLNSLVEYELILPNEQDEPKDFKFVKWLCRRHRLATIPCSRFYSKKNHRLTEKYIRFCFFKSDETIEAADQMLTRLTNYKND